MRPYYTKYQWIITILLSLFIVPSINCVYDLLLVNQLPFPIKFTVEYEPLTGRLEFIISNNEKVVSLPAQRQTSVTFDMHRIVKKFTIETDRLHQYNCVLFTIENQRRISYKTPEYLALSIKRYEHDQNSNSIPLIELVTITQDKQIESQTRLLLI